MTRARTAGPPNCEEGSTDTSVRRARAHVPDDADNGWQSKHHNQAGRGTRTITPETDNTMSNRTLVIIPTYNERENLPTVVSALFDNVPDANLLIVDDGSPDGTGGIADQMAHDDPRVFAMHRTGKLGLGSAYLLGFAWGLERGYDILVEMDADGSHPAQTLPTMLETVGRESVSGSPALVIGSRWVPGGAVVNWPKSREILSRAGNVYTRVALGLPVKDATAGFRAYRADALAALDLTTVDSYGYCFQVDMTMRMIDAGHTVREVPIVFREREVGESKMSRAIVLEAMWKVTLWGAARRARQVRAALTHRTASRAVGGSLGSRPTR